MKFREDRLFAGVDAAVKKLMEIANGLEPDHAALFREWRDIFGWVRRFVFEVVVWDWA